MHTYGLLIPQHWQFLLANVTPVSRLANLQRAAYSQANSKAFSTVPHCCQGNAFHFLSCVLLCFGYHVRQVAYPCDSPRATCALRACSELSQKCYTTATKPSIILTSFAARVFTESVPIPCPSSPSHAALPLPFRLLTAQGHQPCSCPARMECDADDSAVPQQQLPTALHLHVLSLLPPNERALSGRFVCREAADAFSEPQHCTASLSQPLPAHAASWAQEAGQHHVNQLLLPEKFQLLSTAARSGSEVNLEVAWALLQLSIFPELLLSHDNPWRIPLDVEDPSRVAAEAGHPQLLGWFLRHCPRLVNPRSFLEDVAEHCSLPVLQATWEELQALPTTIITSSSCCRSSSSWLSDSPALDLSTLRAAAASRTPDAIAKMQWVLENGGEGCRMDSSVAATAASLGDLGKLRWLRDRGFQCDQWVLCSALEWADLPTAQWLLDEGMCDLPEPGRIASKYPDPYEDLDNYAVLGWDALLEAAAASADGVAKFGWLQERGGPALDGAGLETAPRIALAAARSGNVEVMSHLLSIVPANTIKVVRAGNLMHYARSSGKVPMAECLRQSGVVMSGLDAYILAGRSGSVDMVRWLATEAGLSSADMRLVDLQEVIHQWPLGRRGLTEAMQLLMGARCTAWSADLVCSAAERGDQELVQFLLQLPPEHAPNGKLAEAAVRGGCVALVEWLAAEHPGCLTRSALAGKSLYNVAAANGDRGVLEALRRLGVPWGVRDVVVREVKGDCCMPVLRWLVEAGAPVGSWQQMDKAVEKRVEAKELSAEEEAWLRGLAYTEAGEWW